MVIDENTLVPMHQLTKKGEQEYRRYLTFEADKLIYLSKHPIDKVIYKIGKFFDIPELYLRIEDKVTTNV